MRLCLRGGNVPARQILRIFARGKTPPSSVRDVLLGLGRIGRAASRPAPNGPLTRRFESARNGGARHTAGKALNGGARSVTFAAKDLPRAVARLRRDPIRRRSTGTLISLDGKPTQGPAGRGNGELGVSLANGEGPTAQMGGRFSLSAISGRRGRLGSCRWR